MNKTLKHLTNFRFSNSIVVMKFLSIFNIIIKINYMKSEKRIKINCKQNESKNLVILKKTKKQKGIKNTNQNQNHGLQYKFQLTYIISGPFWLDLL